MKNILFLTHYDGLLGSSRSLLDLLDGFARTDIIPFVVIPKGGEIESALDSRRIQYRIVPFPCWLTRTDWTLRQRLRYIKDSRTALEQLIRLTLDHPTQLVYSNSSIFSIGAMIARRAGLPHIWHIREFGDLDFSLNFIFPKWLCQRYIRTSQAIICNSQAVKKHFFQDWTNEKVHVIYNGVATKVRFDRLAELARQRRPDDIFTFLYIGSISQKKGIEVAIKACAELLTKGLNVRLRIVGSGRESYVNHCRNLVESLGIAVFVEFCGYMLDPYDAYFASNCLLMCSEHEAFGRVTAEAMSACLPVIGRNSGGTPEVIVDGETGFLYNTFDELVEAMLKLVQNPELGQKMGLTGWQRARELFNIEDYAANVYRVIHSVMEN